MSTMQGLQAIFAAAAVSLALSAPALAEVEVPQLSLVFKDPTGTALATDTIDVWVTLSFSGTEAFSFDLSQGEPDFGLPSSFLPLRGNNPGLDIFDAEFASFTGAYLYTVRFCSGTFTTGCGGPPYEVDGVVSGNGWFDVGDTYTLAAGATQDFLLYTLTPTGGTAAPGTYEFRNIGLGIAFEGLDLDGNEIRADVQALTCPDFDPSCSFSRVVTAVPEPSSWAMMLGGLAFAAGVARRRLGQGAV